MELPGGEVTFLFTDIEGSTRILQRLGFDATIVFDAHDRILRRAFAAHGGIELRTAGDSFFVAFERSSDAVAAALDAQRALASYPWPDGGEVRVRIGMHTGSAAVGESGYIGLAVHAAARICAGAAGGRVLLSGDTLSALDRPVFAATFVDLGDHELRDIPQRHRLYELEHPSLARLEPDESGVLAG